SRKNGDLVAQRTATRSRKERRLGRARTATWSRKNGDSVAQSDTAIRAALLRAATVHAVAKVLAAHRATLGAGVDAAVRGTLAAEAAVVPRARERHVADVVREHRAAARRASEDAIDGR